MAAVIRGRHCMSSPRPDKPVVKLMKLVAVFAFGGTERQFVNLGLALDPSRFSLYFGCLRRIGQLLEEIDARGVPILDYNVWTFKHPRVLAAQLRLARDIRRLGIDIVHTYNFYANVFGILPAKLAGARVVASIRDMGPYLSPRRRWIQRYACGFADRILVNANAIKDWLVADGYDGGRITVIPNGVDVVRFDQPVQTGSLHRELGLPADAPLIGVVGRVMPLKGLEDFLSAAAIVASRCPAARFVIIGDRFTATAQCPAVRRDDTYQQELMRIVAHLGLQERVVFTGFRSDVERILPELSVSVLASLSEGLSNTLLESMAAGVPVVATRVGGTGEVVQDRDNGLLVRSGDPCSLADAICRFLETPAFAARLAQAGRLSVTEQFSMSRMVEATSLSYESLLRRDIGTRRMPALVNPI